MLSELCLYLELLIFLAGTFLYRFLTRELFRRPQVLPGNWPLRALLVSLTSWYGLTLADQLLEMLFGRPEALAIPATVLDLARGWAWLTSFPLLAHTLVHALIEADAGARPSGARPSAWRFLPHTAYLSLGFFVRVAIDFVLEGEPFLALSIRQIFPQVAAYAVVMLIVTGAVALDLVRRVRDDRFAGFLRLLVGVLALMAVLLVAGAWRDPWAADAGGLDRALRTLLLGGLVLPGTLFAYYVQRYNLLRLSVSHRTLRHFAAVLLLVSLVMLGGPTLGFDDFAVFRRFVAWGLLVALFLGFAYQPLVDRALRRSTALRRFLGKTMSPHDLEHLMQSLEDPDLDEATVLERTAAELGRWLGADAVFVRPADGDPYAPFRDYFRRAEAPVVHRLDPPTAELALLLDRHRLHAVFPLRVEGRLETLLVLSVSALGGGYDMAEIEAVRQLIRQVAGTLALRRLAAARLAEERLVAERAEEERLRMLGLVAASLAHEVKNPLSSMKVLAQALREDLAADGAHADGVADLDVILEQIERLHRTAYEILGLARPGSGEATELTSLVRSSLYVLRAEARKRGVELDGSGVEEVGEVPGSETAWQTVVFNLMLNAVEATPAGETAAVRLGADGDGGVVFVTENPGEALAPEEVRRLFEPFVSDGGTGLGLTLVRRRVEELGATLGVDHEAGRIRFRVDVPESAAEAGAAQSRSVHGRS